MQIPSFLQTGRVIESSRRIIGEIDNTYISKCLDTHFQSYFQLTVAYNISRALDYIESNPISGLILPHGHGDYNTLSNLGIDKKTLDFPVFKGYEYRLDTAKEAFNLWLATNFPLCKPK